jgi:Fe-S cluster assembly ATP-binding protein
MLKITNLYAKREKKEILKGVNLDIGVNKTHVILGPNGSGKSTLANTLMGSPNLEVTKGSIVFGKKNITSLEPNERAKLGLFLAFQYPQEISGVSLPQFLKLCYQEIHGDVSFIEFDKLLKKSAKNLNLNPKLLSRSLNEGFSGGEKKKGEVLQMSVLNPKFVILDETDSGLDVSALKSVAEGIRDLKKVTQMSVLIITHYSRILKYLKPDEVSILNDGKIIKTGGMDLVEKIEESGYEYLGI